MLPGGSVVKTSPANTGDLGMLPRSGRSPGEGNGNQFEYSFFFFSLSILAWEIPWTEEPGKL